MSGARQRSVFPVNLALELFGHKHSIVIKAAVVSGLLGFAFWLFQLRPGVTVGRAAIFPVAGTAVVDAHHDQLLDSFGVDKFIDDAIQFPTAPSKAAVCAGRAEDILTVV